MTTGGGEAANESLPARDASGMLYRHVPLAEPSDQIRLLRIDTERSRDDGLRLSLSTCRLSEAPVYVAISYTWGPERPLLPSSSSTATGCLCGRTAISRSASASRMESQVRSGSMPSCIDQDNLEEKGRQVAIMGAIFARASRTLISLGPVASAVVATHSRFVDLVSERARALGPVVFDAESEIEPDDLALRQGLEELAAVEYWRRLWILQELKMSKHIAILYPGREPVDLALVVKAYLHLWKRGKGIPNPSRDTRSHNRQSEFSRHLGNLYPETRYFDLAAFTSGPHRHRGHMWAVLDMLYQESSAGATAEDHEIARTDQAPADINWVLETFGRWRCADPCDRIYGMLSLIDWPSDMPALQPDYSCSRAELAVHIMRYRGCRRVVDGEWKISTKVARSLVTSLELTEHDILNDAERVLVMLRFAATADPVEMVARFLLAEATLIPRSSLPHAWDPANW